MANSTVEYILRVKDDATATLKDSASEADKLAGSLGDVEDAAKKAGPYGCFARWNSSRRDFIRTSTTTSIRCTGTINCRYTHLFARHNGNT